MAYIAVFAAGFFVGMIITACIAVSAQEDRRAEQAERRER